RIAIFDKLQLRSALADIFSSIGLEHEQTWRVAARIRLLLWQADNPSASIETEEFWSNPDVRWLTSVNESSGKTYFNKELFEELLSWLQLTALLEIAQQDSGESRSISEVEAVVSRACRAAEQAGYNLEAYLGLLKISQSIKE
ncbi:MAG: alpha-amylase, partial [Edaphobacter sp.]